MRHPELPFDTTQKFNLEVIWFEVCRELTDPEFKMRSHPNRKTYNIGCRGPLCRKAIRDYSGRRNSVLHPVEKLLVLNEILLFFKSEAEKQIAEHEAAILGKLLM